MTRQVLIAGCGYIGRQIAKAEQDRGAEITALVRSESSQEALQQLGYNVFRINLDTPSIKWLEPLNAFDVLYYLIAPQAQGKSDLRSDVFIHLLGNHEVNKIVLISTTGVYGNCQGQWINESQSLAPNADRSFRRVSAEAQWCSYCEKQSIPLIVLRVGGIYGADRLPEARLRRGEPVLAIKESPWSNRIYAKDLVKICLASGSSLYNGVLNAVDDEPGTMTEYFFRIADYLDIPRPAEIPLHAAKTQLSPGMLSYLLESRRIDNSKMKKELGIQLDYPTLEEGLRDIAQESSEEKI